MQPLISIAIPTYNRADGFLQNVVRCALDQTYENIEILVCDNASSDATESVLTEMARAESRIRYVRHAENMGAHANFNFAVQDAKGAFVVLLHDDDAIDPEFVSACVRSLNNADVPAESVGLVRTGVRVIDGEGIVKSEHPIQKLTTDGGVAIKNWAEGHYLPYLCNTLFNRDLLLEAGSFQSPAMCLQDLAVNIKLLATHPCVEVSEVLASFRVHENETTHTLPIEKWLTDAAYILDVVVPETPDLFRAKSESYIRSALTRLILRRCTEKGGLMARSSAYRASKQKLNIPVSSMVFNEFDRLKSRVIHRISNT